MPQTKNFLIGCTTIVVAIVVLAGIGSAMKKAGSAASPSQPGASGAQAAADPPEPTAPPMTVMAKQLHDDYAANEVSADDKYKGKLLAVGGTVASIDKDPFDNIVLKISWPGENEFGLDDVMATLRDNEKPKAAQLTKGQPVVVRCQGNGLIMKSPMLSDCVVFAKTK